MLKLGERVAVLTRSKTGTDEMGEPVYTWASEVVDDCLVRPLSGSDLTNSRSSSDGMRPDGVLVQYSVAFPKTYKGNLVHARVVLIDRGGDVNDIDAALRVSGAPDRTVPCPTRWNMIAEVGVLNG